MAQRQEVQADSGVADRGRYRRILLFFAGIVAHLILIDLLLGRLPLVRRWVRRSRPARLRRLARRFRQLATSMGGVLIKLGQFFSARVDVLPAEITEELAGLQDEVPPVPPEEVETVLAAELGEVGRHFARLEREPLAAASLGQAHRAWLLPANGAAPQGQPVVVKVQRPGIEAIVRTDLAALRLVARWAALYGPIRRRANVPALMDEFARTLWEELDYRAEAANAERFALMFAENAAVCIPAVYWQHSTGRVLTLENVEAIRITDVPAMTDAGIDPREVAARVLDVYFTQIFQEGFFHADPHPGNLFVRPVPGDTAPTPFVLIFVDFGMVGRVKELVGQNLRRVLLSVTQRDAAALTAAYADMGFFLPGADLDRIAEAQAVMLERIWGRNLLEMARPDPQEMLELGLQFRDILQGFPFQVPQDFIYLGRAMGMISGLTSLLDPDINPWYHLERFASSLVQSQQVGAFALEQVVAGLRELVLVPGRAQRLLEAAEQGKLRVRSLPDPATTRRLERLERRVSGLNWGLVATGALLSGTVLYLEGALWLAALFWAGAGILLLLSLFK